MAFNYSLYGYQLNLKIAREHLTIVHFLESKSHKAITTLIKHLEQFKEQAIKELKLANS